jgi:hypothetical protein
VAKIRVKYAECLVRLERPAEAEAQLKAALPILEGSLGPGDELTRRAAALLAGLAAAAGGDETANRRNGGGAK